MASPPALVPPPDRLPGIEGLRAIAATAVVAHHNWILPRGERVGADAGAGAIFLNLALGVTVFVALLRVVLSRPCAAAIARRTRHPGSALSYRFEPPTLQRKNCRPPMGAEPIAASA